MNSDSIINALGEIRGLQAGSEMPSSDRLESIRALGIKSLTPVRPLPSNGILILLALAGFVVVSLLAAVSVGFLGFHHLSLTQKLAYYAVISFSAIVLATTLVKGIVPGSRYRIAPGLAMLLALVALVVIVVALSPELDFNQFVRRGLPCLRLGTICAAFSGGLAYLFVRKGFSSSPIRTAVAAGLFAGLTGFAVLALHCPIENVAHILVWHLGAVLLAAAAGALLGLWRPIRN